MTPFYLLLPLIISTVVQAQDHISIFNKGIEAQNNQQYKKPFNITKNVSIFNPIILKQREALARPVTIGPYKIIVTKNMRLL